MTNVVYNKLILVKLITHYVKFAANFFDSTTTKKLILHNDVFTLGYIFHIYNKAHGRKYTWSLYPTYTHIATQL